MQRNKGIITFTSIGNFQMVIDTMTKPVDPLKIVRKSDGRVLLMKFRNNFVNGWWNFLKKRVVDKFKEAVKRKLRIV